VAAPISEQPTQAADFAPGRAFLGRVKRRPIANRPQDAILPYTEIEIGFVRIAEWPEIVRPARN